MSDHPASGSQGFDPNDFNPDELREIIQEMLAGGQGFDPAKLAGVGGLPNDPAAVRALVDQMRSALSTQSAGLDWSGAESFAKHVSGPSEKPVSPEEKTRINQAFHLASLWLGEVTDMTGGGQPQLLTRSEWIAGSMPTWSTLAEPVADSIADALSSALASHVPPEMMSQMAESSSMMRNVGGALFTMQLGQVVGGLACEVTSGGDIGVPVLKGRRAALIPQNVASFAEGLDVPQSEVDVFLAVRELAHAALFQHAKWLELHLSSQIAEFAQGISVDLAMIDELAASIDPGSPDEIRAALERGDFIPPRTPEQEQALARIETMLALVEGWVDAVTAAATTRLPMAPRLREAMRRRRATGGPAEHALGALIGLELRPRKLREAAAMWQRIGDELGSSARDALWDQFDELPGADDLENPDGLIRRMSGADHHEPDRMDAALAELLNNPASFGEAPEGGRVRTLEDELAEVLGSDADTDAKQQAGDPADPNSDGRHASDESGDTPPRDAS